MSERRDVVGTAKALGMCRTHVLSVGASCSSFSGESDFTVIVTAREVFSFGGATDEEGEEAEMAQLGHREGPHTEHVPRMIEALSGKKVIGVAAGEQHTAVWTEIGELFAFGSGSNGRLGHGGNQIERVPRLVEGSCRGEGDRCSAQVVFTQQRAEHVPRLVEALLDAGGASI